MLFHYDLELVDGVHDGLLLPSQLFKGFGGRLRMLLQEFLAILELGQILFQIDYHGLEVVDVALNEFFKRHLEK